MYEDKQVVLKDILHRNYYTMDIDADLHPDYIGSVLDIPFADKQYDVVACYEVLEHLPFSNFENVLSELFCVSNKAVVISLPDADENYLFVHIPIFLILFNRYF